MPSAKELISIKYVSDTDSGMYHLGELEWCSFDEDHLEDYIKRFGHEELCVKLAYLQFQVWQSLRQINSEKDTHIGKSVNA